MDGYISRKQNSTTGYLFKNAHGDVLAAYSSTSNKLADYSYTAWGEQQSVNETSSFTNNPLRYCGEYYDCESGMTYLRARYYDSNIKRFISDDPAMHGVNWYAYCRNNPVMFVDPYGLCEKCFGNYEDYQNFTYQETEKQMAESANVYQPITIVESKYRINIYAYVNIRDNAANDMTEGVTYRKAALEGIIQYWSGNYEGRPVSVFVLDLSDGQTHYTKPNQRSYNIYINDGQGSSEHWGWKNKNSIGNTTLYCESYKYFKATSAHEFGHALGVGDLYDDPGIPIKFTSIMNNQYDVSGALPVDYALVFKVHEVNKFQYWRHNTTILNRMGITYK